jgi:predicted DNA-binding transcriptional regulator AlpA
MTEMMSRKLPDVLGQERVLSAQQAAELYGVSVATFRRQYWAGKVPPALRVSDRRLGWRVRDLIDHLKKSGEVAA